MSDFYATQMYLTSSGACAVDTTPPTFAGVNALTVNLNGSFTPSWLAATDTTPTIEYEVFVKEGTSTGLFSSANSVGCFKSLNATIFALKDGTFFERGKTYHFGVRAKDGVGNQETNIVTLNGVSKGVLIGEFSDYLLQLLAKNTNLLSMEIQAIQFNMETQAAQFEMEIQSAEEDL